MTPWATVTVTGCADCIPDVPNPGDAVTTATGAGVAVVGALPFELPPEFGAACESPPAGCGPASEPPTASGGEVEVEDSCYGNRALRAELMKPDRGWGPDGGGANPAGQTQRGKPSPADSVPR